MADMRVGVNINYLESITIAILASIQIRCKY